MKHKHLLIWGWMIQLHSETNLIKIIKLQY